MKNKKQIKVPKVVITETNYFQEENSEGGGKKKQKGIVIPINPNIRIIDKK